MKTKHALCSLLLDDDFAKNLSMRQEQGIVGIPLEVEADNYFVSQFGLKPFRFDFEHAKLTINDEEYVNGKLQFTDISFDTLAKGQFLIEKGVLKIKLKDTQKSLQSFSMPIVLLYEEKIFCDFPRIENNVKSNKFFGLLLDENVDSTTFFRETDARMVYKSKMAEIENRDYNVPIRKNISIEIQNTDGKYNNFFWQSSIINREYVFAIVECEKNKPVSEYYKKTIISRGKVIEAGQDLEKITLELQDPLFSFEKENILYKYSDFGIRLVDEEGKKVDDETVPFIFGIGDVLIKGKRLIGFDNWRSGFFPLDLRLLKGVHYWPAGDRMRKDFGGDLRGGTPAFSWPFWFYNKEKKTNKQIGVTELNNRAFRIMKVFEDRVYYEETRDISVGTTAVLLKIGISEYSNQLYLHTLIQTMFEVFWNIKPTDATFWDLEELGKYEKSKYADKLDDEGSFMPIIAGTSEEDNFVDLLEDVLKKANAFFILKHNGKFTVRLKNYGIEKWRIGLSKAEVFPSVITADVSFSTNWTTKQMYNDVMISYEYDMLAEKNISTLTKGVGYLNWYEERVKREKLISLEKNKRVFLGKKSEIEVETNYLYGDEAYRLQTYLLEQANMRQIEFEVETSVDISTLDLYDIIDLRIDPVIQKFRLPNAENKETIRCRVFGIDRAKGKIKCVSLK